MILATRSPMHFSWRGVKPEAGSPSSRLILRLPMLTWVPLLARLMLEVWGIITRLLVMMPASRIFITAFKWLRLKTWWQRIIYWCLASPSSQPERQGLMNSLR